MACTFWFDRFQVHRISDVELAFRDRLDPRARVVPATRFEGLAGRDLALELFRLGFLRSPLPPAVAPVQPVARDADDLFFWQFPCRTEAAAYEQHSGLGEVRLENDTVHVYLGLPWATWIDRKRVDPDQRRARNEISMQRVRVSGFKRALDGMGVGLRLHTVCQHVYWPTLTELWQELGITDLWLSHASTQSTSTVGTLSLHPWRLFAVNVEDPTRCVGLQIGVDPQQKPLLASFIGAHADHYLTDIRLRLRSLAHEPGFLVRITDKWHFEDVVYGHQVMREPLDASYRIDSAVSEYNRVLSDSVFSLCPAGAGPNTLRLWESLAVGAVPVLLGPAPRLPQGGTLPPLDWEQIVLRVPDEKVGDLPRILRGIPMDEVRRRQRLGMEAFAMTQGQRCF